RGARRRRPEADPQLHDCGCGAVMNTSLSFNFDAVRQWAEEVWADLRESRLAGVAVGLALLLLVITASAVRSGGPLDIEPTAAGPAPTATPQDTSFQFPGEEPMSIKDIEASKA